MIFLFYFVDQDGNIKGILIFKWLKVLGLLHIYCFYFSLKILLLLSLPYSPM